MKLASVRFCISNCLIYNLISWLINLIISEWFGPSFEQLFRIGAYELRIAMKIAKLRYKMEHKEIDNTHKQLQ